MSLPIAGILLDNKLLAALPRGQMDLLAPLARSRVPRRNVMMPSRNGEFTGA
jgi:hypothetical protein